MNTHLGIADLARALDEQYRIKVPPRRLSDLFYAAAFDRDRCPVIAGRRLIPVDYVEEIAEVLRNRTQDRVFEEAS